MVNFFTLTDGNTFLDLSRWVTSISESDDTSIEIYQYLDGVTVDAEKVAATIPTINFTLIISSSIFGDFNGDDVMLAISTIKKWAASATKLSGNILGVSNYQYILTQATTTWVRQSAKNQVTSELAGTIIRTRRQLTEINPTVGVGDTPIRRFRIMT